MRCFRDFFNFFGNPSKFKFWGVSSFFWSIYQNCISVSALFLRGFTIFLIHFLIFLIRFRFFLKLYNWSVSPYFWSVSSNFWSAFFKNFKNLNLLIGFLKFLIRFLIFLIRFLKFRSFFSVVCILWKLTFVSTYNTKLINLAKEKHFKMNLKFLAISDKF